MIYTVKVVLLKLSRMGGLLLLQQSQLMANAFGLRQNVLEEKYLQRVNFYKSRVNPWVCASPGRLSRRRRGSRRRTGLAPEAGRRFGLDRRRA